MHNTHTHIYIYIYLCPFICLLTCAQDTHTYTCARTRIRTDRQADRQTDNQKDTRPYTHSTSKQRDLTQRSVENTGVEVGFIKFMQPRRWDTFLHLFLNHVQTFCFGNRLDSGDQRFIAVGECLAIWLRGEHRAGFYCMFGAAASASNLSTVSISISNDWRRGTMGSCYLNI